jgi:hypothetical protein
MGSNSIPCATPEKNTATISVIRSVGQTVWGGGAGDGKAEIHLEISMKSFYFADCIQGKICVNNGMVLRLKHIRLMLCQAQAVVVMHESPSCLNHPG